MLVNLPLNIL